MKNSSWLPCSFLVAALFVVSVPLASAEDNPADERVALVQQALKLKHFYYGDVDGTFDCATQGALRRFQFRNGLPGTGAMDDATVKALTGYTPPSKTPVASVVVQAASGRDIFPQIQKDDNRAGVKEDPNAGQKRKLSAIVNTREQRIVPRGGYTEQFPSWAAEHRAGFEDRVEVRRAIPIASGPNREEPFASRATPVSPENSIDGVESQEVVTTVVAHFSGQDGHVYTYYRKIRTRLPDVSSGLTSPYGRGETAVSFPREISVGGGNRGGDIANR